MAAQITALPTPPSRQAPATFSERADEFLGALPTFVTEANTLASEAEADAAAAATQAGIAADKATEANNYKIAAEAAANAAQLFSSAPVWASGTTYSIGDAVWSPLNYQTYRRITNGAGTTDPSQDDTNWTGAVTINLPITRETYQSTGGL